MSGDLVGLVRAACNEEGASRLPCMYPECGCQFRNHPYALSALITAAEARGAAAEREACVKDVDLAWHDGARSATDATARMIQRRLSRAELIAHGQGNPPGWMGAIFQCKEFLNALRSDKPPGHAVRAAAIRARSTASEAERLWQPIETAPTDGTLVWVYVAAYEDLPAFQSVCSWHPDAGWCCDELRTVTHWMPMKDMWRTPPTAAKETPNAG